MTFVAKIRDLLRAEQDPRTVTHIPAARVSGGTGGTALQPGNTYIRLWLSQLHLRYRREFFRERYPVVQAHTEVSTNGGRREIPCVIGPEAIVGADVSQAGDVIHRDRILVDQVPYIGGSVDIDAGLFAATARDLLSDLLSVLGQLSPVVAGPGGAAAVDVVRAIKSGAERIVAGLGEQDLKIGVSLALSGDGLEAPPALRDGYYAVVDADVPADELHVMQGALHRDAWDGPQPLTDADFMLLRLEAVEAFEDWRRLRDLDRRYRDVVRAVGDAREPALDAFAQELLLSDDLIDLDRKRIWRAVRHAGTGSIAQLDDDLAGRLAAGDPTPRDLGDLEGQAPPPDAVRDLSLDDVFGPGTTERVELSRVSR